MRLPRLKPGDAIEVIWIDSHYQAEKGWMAESDLSEAGEITVRSVCQYISKDKQYLYTVADRSIEQPAGVMRDLKIPLGCVKNVSKLTQYVG